MTRRRYVMPKPDQAKDRAARDFHRRAVQRRPEGMSPGMVQVLATLRLLATQGHVDPYLLDPACIRDIRGERSYGEVVIGNVVHALATPVEERRFRRLDLVLRPCVCQLDTCICGVVGMLNRVPYLNIDLRPMLEGDA